MSVINSSSEQCTDEILRPLGRFVDVCTFIDLLELQ
jgi:hypothetical protein